MSGTAGGGGIDDPFASSDFDDEDFAFFEETDAVGGGGGAGFSVDDLLGFEALPPETPPAEALPQEQAPSPPPPPPPPRVEAKKVKEAPAASKRRGQKRKVLDDSAEDPPPPDAAPHAPPQPVPPPLTAAAPAEECAFDLAFGFDGEDDDFGPAPTEEDAATRPPPVAEPASAPPPKRKKPTPRFKAKLASTTSTQPEAATVAPATVAAPPPPPPPPSPAECAYLDSLYGKEQLPPSCKVLFPAEQRGALVRSGRFLADVCYAGGDTGGAAGVTQCLAVPTGFVGSLFPHQKAALSFAFRGMMRAGGAASVEAADASFPPQVCGDLRSPHSGVVLAHEMGSGKTLTSLLLLIMYHLALRQRHGGKVRSVIVVPPSLVASWFAECKKHFGYSALLTAVAGEEENNNGLGGGGGAKQAASFERGLPGMHRTVEPWRLHGGILIISYSRLEADVLERRRGGGGGGGDDDELDDAAGDDEDDDGTAAAIAAAAAAATAAAAASYAAPRAIDAEHPVLRLAQMVVYDEAQGRLAGPTNAYRIARALSTKARVLLTGTLMENRLEEIYRLIELVKEGFVTRPFFDSCTRRVMRARVKATADAQVGSKKAGFLLQSLLSDVVNRRRCQRRFKELPALRDYVVTTSLTLRQMALYRALCESTGAHADFFKVMLALNHIVNTDGHSGGNALAVDEHGAATAAAAAAAPSAAAPEAPAAVEFPFTVMDREELLRELGLRNIAVRRPRSSTTAELQAKIAAFDRNDVYRAQALREQREREAAGGDDGDASDEFSAEPPPEENGGGGGEEGEEGEGVCVSELAAPTNDADDDGVEGDGDGDGGDGSGGEGVDGLRCIRQEQTGAEWLAILNAAVDARRTAEDASDGAFYERILRSEERTVAGRGDVAEDRIWERVMPSDAGVRAGAALGRAMAASGFAPGRGGKLYAMCGILGALRCPRTGVFREKALVFSTYRRVLHAAQESAVAHLGERGTRGVRVRTALMDGSMTLTARSRIVAEFDRGDLDVLFLSVGTGGTGLNLQAARTVVLLDGCWNPGKNMQAICRAYRVGQTHPVSAYRLVSRGTYEEDVMRKCIAKDWIKRCAVDGDACKSLAYMKDSLSLMIEEYLSCANINTPASSSEATRMQEAAADNDVLESLFKAGGLVTAMSYTSFFQKHVALTWDERVDTLSEADSRREGEGYGLPRRLPTCERAPDGSANRYMQDDADVDEVEEGAGATAAATAADAAAEEKADAGAEGGGRGGGEKVAPPPPAPPPPPPLPLPPGSRPGKAVVAAVSSERGGAAGGVPVVPAAAAASGGGGAAVVAAPSPPSPAPGVDALEWCAALGRGHISVADSAETQASLCAAVAWELAMAKLKALEPLSFR